jgi:NAD(P)-dependent dehydrogenase (short-subunit alcohol dehydrogenase family)
VVTGAASGIGRASALRLAREGAEVFAADIDAAAGAALAAGAAGTIHFVATDVCDVAAITRLMDHAAERTGGIDIVFNNAGAVGDRAKIDAIDAEGWDRTMALLLRSVAMGIRYAVPHMIGRPSTQCGGASIINTASITALSAGFGPTAYSVAKAGVLHLSKLAAADLASHDIRVNAICPGFIKTSIFASAFDLPPEARQMANAMVHSVAAHAQPVKGGGEPEDIASMVAYLASEEARFITGSHFVVDGGITVGGRHSWDPETPSMFGAMQALAEGQGA